MPLPGPNAFAYLMLALWPLVALGLFRRLDPARALVWTVLGGYLILPPLTALNLPVVPDFDKESIPNLTAAAIAVFVLRERIAWLPAGWVGRGLIGLFVLSPFATVLTNGDPVPLIAFDLPGMRIYDSVAVVAGQAIAILPFFLARHYLATPQALRDALAALALAGLAYSVPMLIEMQVSPQINIWVYGFFQHDFFQTIRFGGFRPVVFLPHGLWVAFFALMAALAALVLLRAEMPGTRPRWLVAALYLMAILVLCKSAGPVVYALALAPMVLLAPPRWQMLLAATLALVVITYPALRGAGLIPVDRLVDAAAQVSAERAHSLQFRIDNETRLLARAMERPWFGWGGYARNLIHDPVSGRILTIADGDWIIVLGIFGWLGYVAEYGLLVLPLLMLAREAVLNRAAVLSPFAAGLALIHAANLVDMLPNATLIPFTWLMAGAILGHAEMLAAARRSGRVAAWQSALSPAPRRTVL